MARTVNCYESCITTWHPAGPRRGLVARTVSCYESCIITWHSTGPRRGLVARSDAVPMHAKLTTAIEAAAGFSAEHSGYSKGKEGQWQRDFIPPCTLRCECRALGL